MFDVLSRMTDVLHGMLDSPWLWVVVLLVSGLDAILPFMPSETTVIIVGVLVAPDARQLVLLILVASFGAFAGDVFTYTVGRHAGPAVIARLTRLEHGERRHEWAQTQLGRHGRLLIVAGRYIPGVRMATMLTAGVLRYPTRRFLVTDAVGAGIWATYAALIGFLGGAAFEGNPVMGMLLAFGIGLTLAVLLEVGRRVLSRRAAPRDERSQMLVADN
jgi:membrane-associated protein